MLSMLSCKRPREVDTAAIEQTVERLAIASCDRERQCAQAGSPTGSGASSDECLRDARDTVRHRLDRPECAAGLDAERATSCADQIRKYPCRPEVERFPPLDACSTNALCTRK